MNRIRHVGGRRRHDAGQPRSADGWYGEPVMPTPSLGLNLPYVEGSMAGATPAWVDILAMARAGEAAGLDAVWISDHVGFGDPAGEWSGAWESWTLLSALAASTRRVELGTYVLAAPFRNPALLAKMAETLDEISGGRVILGIGAGWNEAEFTSYDVPFEDRFARFEDALRVITAMLRDGRSTYEGRTITTRSARLEPRGPRPRGLPVMVGANGPRMLRLAAELADHWNGGMRGLDEVPAALAALASACRDAGRDPATLTRSVEVLVVTSAASTDEGAAADPRALSGSHDAIADGLRRFGDLGLDHLQIQLRPNSLAGVEAFAPVIERLR
jgi:probable F420-dependent oxidoreductase